jgi:hypothetical protein
VGEFDSLTAAKEGVEAEPKEIDRELGGRPSSRTRPEEYTLPGGENYRELLLNSPNTDVCISALG